MQHARWWSAGCLKEASRNSHETQFYAIFLDPGPSSSAFAVVAEATAESTSAGSEPGRVRTRHTTAQIKAMPAHHTCRSCRVMEVKVLHRRQMLTKISWPSSSGATRTRVENEGQ